MEFVLNDKQNLLCDDSVNRAKFRANVAFAKFGDNIKSVNITVQDINGPRGGIDKECRVVVKLKKLKETSVTVKDESLSKAVSNAIVRAARSVARQLDRRASRNNHTFKNFGFET